MFTQSVEFGLINETTEVVNFTVYGDGDDASDMLYGLIIDYWRSNEWQNKNIVLPTREDIVDFIMNDNDLDDKEYYLSDIDTLFVDYNTMFNDKWFRFVQEGKL